MTRNHRLVHNLLLEGELLRILPALTDAGIDTVVLKGIPLARRLGRRIDTRAMADADVLVHRTDVERACERLVELGYRHLPRRRLEPQLAIDFQYGLATEVHGEPLAVEIHWSAFQPILHPVPESLLWAHVEPFRLRGLEIKVFDEAMTIVHLAAHYAHHTFSQPRILQELAAAWNLWATKVDGDALIALGRQTGLVHALDYALLSAAELGLLESRPPAIHSKRARRLLRLLPPSRLHEPRPRHDYWRSLLGLLLADPRRIPAWLLPHFFPPIENLSAIHDRPVSPALYARYVTRPFRPIARALGIRFARSRAR